METKPAFLDTTQEQTRYETVYSTLQFLWILMIMAATITILGTSNSTILVLLAVVAVFVNLVALSTYVLKLDLDEFTTSATYNDVKWLAVALAIELCIVYRYIPLSPQYRIMLGVAIAFILAVGFQAIWVHQRRRLQRDSLYMAYERYGYRVTDFRRPPTVSYVYNLDEDYKPFEDKEARRNRLCALVFLVLITLLSALVAFMSNWLFVT